MIADGATGRSDRGERGHADTETPFSDVRWENGAKSSETSPLAPLARDLAALQAYLMHYVSARSDAVSARVKRTLLYAALGIAGLFAAMTALVVAVVQLIVGIAGGLNVAFDSVWAGEVVTGLGLLILMALGAWIGMRYWLNLSRRKAKEKYERRRSQERQTVGRDVVQRAAS